MLKNCLSEFAAAQSASRAAIRRSRAGIARTTALAELKPGQPSRTQQVRRYTGTLKYARAASAAAALHAREYPEPPESETQAQHRAAPPESHADDARVSVGWDARTWSRFHHIWLRDHCRCPECFHQVTKQRLVNTFEIPPDIKPSCVESTPEGLRVTWPSSQPHVSIYPWHWLRRNSYEPVMPDESQRAHEKVLWGAKISQDPPTVEYEYAMHDDRGLLKWLQKIDTFGFCFVSGVPATPEATQVLSERIGNIRETQYGKFWDFTSDLAKGDTAYTTMALQAHTDTTYFTDPCGLQLFHLLSHTDGTGGASLLVDGFYVASILKELHPEVYNLLSTVRVPAHAAGEAASLYRPSLRAGFPILNTDPVSGELVQVRYNNDDRSVMSRIPPGSVESWYAALRMWNKLLRSADSEYWIQLHPGTVVAIDNHRVLHGRSAFDGKRRMCGAYIGIDDYRSRLAVLSEKYAPAGESVAEQLVNGRSVWSALF